MPDIHITIHRTIMEGQYRAKLELILAMVGIAPTRKKAYTMGMISARIENGQFQEENNCFDFLTMYQQLRIVAAT